MRTLYSTVAAVLLMAMFIPNAQELATSPVTPVYTHFVYMIGHATFLHWFINAWTFVLLHNTFRWYRLLVAYLLAVAVSFLPYVATVSQPLIGLSAITTFFFGFITPHLWRRNRSSVYIMAGILLVGIFLPHIAALLHIILYLLGIVYYRIEHFIRNLYNFISE